MSDMNRREFVTTLTIAGVACATCGGLASVAEAAEETSTVIDAGDVKDIVQGVTDKLVKSNKIVIVRQGQKVHASTSSCPHKGCNVKATPNADQLICPCHKSYFKLDGSYVRGPAKIGLDRYAVSVQDGKLMIDKSKTIPEDKWDTDESANVTVPS